MEDKKEIEEKVKKAREVAEKLDEPFKSITFKTLLEKFLHEEQEVNKTVIPVTAEPKITSEIPQISEQSSVRRTIIALLTTPWGNIPRTFKEIKETLKTNAIYYPDNTSMSQLTFMTKRGELRRLKKGDVFAYVLSRK